MKRTKFSKCKCGCGGYVSKKGNRYIVKHNFRDKENTSKEAELLRREKIGKTLKERLQDPDLREKLFNTAWKGRPEETYATKQNLRELLDQ